MSKSKENTTSKIKLFPWVCHHLIAISVVMALMVISIVSVSMTAAHAASSGLACAFDAPLGANGLGHVGWGFQISNSTFVYGSTENPNTNYAILSDGKGGYIGYSALGTVTGATTLGSWSRQGSFAQMLNDFQRQPQWGTWPEASLDRQSNGNEYTLYKCITVTNSSVTNADNAVSQVQNYGYYSGIPGGGTGAATHALYSLAGWNCMNQVDYILSAYNTQGLPSPSSNPSNWPPNNWFAAINANALSINGAGYSVIGASSNGLAVYKNGPDGSGGTFSKNYAPNGTYLIIVCQTTFGAQEDGRTLDGQPLAFTTWDMLSDGTFVYGWYMNTPSVHADGYSHIPGIPACVSDDFDSNW